LKEEAASQGQEARRLQKELDTLRADLGQAEGRDKQLVLTVKALEAKLEAATSKLEKIESGKEYKRLLESEERLKEVSAYLESLQEGLNASQLALQKKEGLEVYLQEIVGRLKEQLAERD
jgi:septal ring factor EnvC (AmiA/AmiB activator)